MMTYRIRNSTPLKIVFGVFLFLAVIQVLSYPSGRHFILNLTGSEPRGIYFLKTFDGALHRGDLVFMKCPLGFEKFIYGRKWLPDGWPLLKTVRGIPGDSFCVSETDVSVEGKRFGPVYSFDRQGFPLPVIRGCRTVPPSHFLPIATGLDNSFDGRYFGAVHNSLIIGRAMPIISF
jgi:conjugative transfer signal peptidase TraF